VHVVPVPTTAVVDVVLAVVVFAVLAVVLTVEIVKVAFACSQSSVPASQISFAVYLRYSL
jgi:hypothetical protein